jgi:hypothetical protein
MTAIADRPTVADDALAASDQHLLARLAVVEARVEAAVSAGCEAASPEAERPRGVYVGVGDVVSLLRAGPADPVVLPEESAEFFWRVEAEVDGAEATGSSTRLRLLQRHFDLDDIDVELLLAALAPDVDARFERFYGFLNDDLTRRRLSVGLGLRLCGLPGAAGAARRRLGPGGPLVRFGLVEITDPDRPFLSRGVHVPDRVAGYLLGDDTPDPLVAPLLAHMAPGELGDPVVLARGIVAGSRLCYVREQRGSAGYAYAATALGWLGMAMVHLDLYRLAVGPLDPAMVVAAGREAALQGGALLVGPVETLADRGPEAVRAMAELPCCTILVGSRTWDPAWSGEAPLIVTAPVASQAERQELWRLAVDGTVDPDVGLEAAADFRLAPAQVAGAVAAAVQVARAAGHDVGVDDLRYGARTQNASGLERLARRIEPAVVWPDLVLPPGTLTRLEELVGRCRHRDTVFDDWKMGGTSTRRRGTIALFAGPPGTGKTMAAEVVAGEFGLDLYVVNLAHVVDKYIGETEKNLERIFSEAERVNGVLFFDEADALFGRRSDVKDARDRYANIEVAYLLQRMELFDGIAVLATNLKTNIDEAFARRLDAAVDFPQPNVGDRTRLWEKSIGYHVPVCDDVDIDFMARSFELSGGSIRNIAVTAAFLAAERKDGITMSDLIHGTEREYRKLGRICTPSEFGPWISMVEAL